MVGQSSTAAKAGENRFCNKFVELVELIIDGEATTAQMAEFNDYYMQCKHCIKYYNIESSTMRFVREQLKKNNFVLNVPDTFAAEVQNKAVGATTA
jgi:hypothetical protein